MQKTILAAVVASVFAGQAMAEIKPLSADQFTIGGEATVGGYYNDNADQKYMTDGATVLQLETSYKNGGIVGYVEVDIKAEYGRGMDEDVVSDLDKAWIGYDFGFGTLSYALENDTALDAVDGAGDMTYEFGMSAPDASDAFDVVKFQGGVSGFAYGVSYFETDEDKDQKEGKQSGYNGYVGFEADMFSVYAGYEKKDAAYRDDDGNATSLIKGEEDTVSTVTGNIDLGAVQLGANIWKAEVFTAENVSEEHDGFYVSAASTFNTLTLSTGYGEVDHDDKFESYKQFNVAGFYQMSSNTFVGVDVAYNMPEVEIKNDQEDETRVFLKAGYTF
ncbi:porin [Endozoicomonas ascidiicola]|uniref:porin n=1 Tax=Endozoicomonas ascidiicola TaxID=1698521 RepID=UPI000830A4CB|nr:porin [Endozoicomonas ascidiicola]